MTYYCYFLECNNNNNHDSYYFFPGILFLSLWFFSVIKLKNNTFKGTDSSLLLVHRPFPRRVCHTSTPSARPRHTTMSIGFHTAVRENLLSLPVIPIVFLCNTIVFHQTDKALVILLLLCLELYISIRCRKTRTVG